MTALALGDVVTCSGCGAKAVAHTTGDPAAWGPGRPLVLSWRGRHLATLEAPDLCLWCRDGLAPPAAPPTRRVAIVDDLQARGCRLDGFEWNTDALIEDAYQGWIARGSPPLALVSVENKGALQRAPAPEDAAAAFDAAVGEAQRVADVLEAPARRPKPTKAQGSLF